MSFGTVAVNVLPVVLLGIVALGMSGRATKATMELQSTRVAVGGFEVADDLSTARVELDLEAGVSTDAGTIEDGGLALPLEIGPGAEMQATTATLRRAGRILGQITVEYYPPTLYQRLGTTDPGYVSLVTNMPRQAAEPVAATPPEPTGPPGPIDPAVVSLVAAKVNWIQVTNRTDSGRVCPGATGAELTTQIAIGECYVWCTGMAIIVRDALRDAGYVARVDYLEPDMRTLPTGIIRQSSEAHASVEYRDTAGWHWIDPTYGVHAGGLSLGAFLAQRDAASLVSFAHAGDLTLALERYLTADKVVVPDND